MYYYNNDFTCYYNKSLNVEGHVETVAGLGTSENTRYLLGTQRKEGKGQRGEASNNIQQLPPAVTQFAQEVKPMHYPDAMRG